MWSRAIGSGGCGCDLRCGVLLELRRVELGHAFDLHGAVLELPVVVLLEKDRADEPCDDGLDNLANIAFEWTVAVGRERLRPRYREGFGQPPLNLHWQPDLRASPEGGADGSPPQSCPLTIRTSFETTRLSAQCLIEAYERLMPTTRRRPRSPLEVKPVEGMAPRARRGNHV